MLESTKTSFSPSDIESVNIRRLHLYSQLHLYGDICPLKFFVDCGQLEKDLAKFKDKWVRYQPSKPETNRMGLSITSLDGNMTGFPDLHSLQEYMASGGENVSENDFNVLTEAGKEIPAIQELIQYFAPSIGRSRLVKFGIGGHFPPHRDQSFSFQVPDYFRIFVPLNRCAPQTLFFIIEDKIIPYETGRAYFFNALKVHTVFSTVPDALTLALSIPLTQDNVAKCIRAFNVR